MAIEEIQSTEIPSVPNSLEDLARWAEDWSRDHFDDLKKLNTILSLVSGGFIEIPADPTVPGADGNWRWYNDGTDLVLQNKVSGIWIDTAIKLLKTGEVKSLAGRIKNTSRYTTTQEIPTTDDRVIANTDAGGWIATLPAGVEGQVLCVKNTGTSGNTLTLSPNGAELLIGVNSSIIIEDSEDIEITYNITDGWY